MFGFSILWIIVVLTVSIFMFNRGVTMVGAHLNWPQTMKDGVRWMGFSVMILINTIGIMIVGAVLF